MDVGGWSGQGLARPRIMTTGHDTLDAYSPAEIARRVESLGVTKARADALSVLLLAGLAGAFIALGGMLFTVVVSESSLGFGPTRLLGGFAFCLGLVLVVVAGAELFTGNNLIAMAWASRRVTFAEVARSWALVYLGNAVGALATVALLVWAETDALGGGLVGETARSIGRAKAELSPAVAFARGVLCNALVCLAVWLAMGGRSLVDKLVAVLFPITAFVALGFEHSIANWFFLPYAIALEGDLALLGGASRNLAVVTAGNVLGGTVLVAGVYWLAYLRRA